MSRAKKAKPNQRSIGAKDIEIGGRLRAMRIDRKMSQDDLGKRLGVSFQQVQKYEKGVNRISASRLHQIASILETSLEQLGNFGGTTAHVNGFEFDAESYKLAKSFSRLPDHLKSKFRSLINSIVDEAV